MRSVGNLPQSLGGDVSLRRAFKQNGNPRRGVVADFSADFVEQMDVVSGAGQQRDLLVQSRQIHVTDGGSMPLFHQELAATVGAQGLDDFVLAFAKSEAIDGFVTHGFRVLHEAGQRGKFV